MNHRFSPDKSAPDWRGRPAECVVCHMPQSHANHRDVPEDSSERIVGDKEGSDG